MAGRVALLSGIGIFGLDLLALRMWAGAGFATPSYVFMRGPLPMLGLLAAVAAQGVAGTILLSRRPANRVGWVIVLFALVTALSAVIIATTAADPDGSRSTFDRWLAWFGGWFLFPTASFLAFLLAFVFPTGALPVGRWSRGLVLVAAACGVGAALVAIRPGPLLFFPLVVNPLALAGLTGVLTPSGMAAAWYTAVPLLLFAGGGIVSGAALLSRYAGATGLLRLQVRWYITVGVILAAAYSAQLTALLVLGPRDPRGELIETATFLTLGMPPIAMTMAILRYRLYDIDTIIGRAFVYGALTAILAGVYTASIRGFNALFSAVTGDTSDIALVITTLLLATTFTPIKGRLEKIAARRLGPPPGESGAAPAQLQPEAPAALLDDPAFLAALDARIRAALAANGGTEARGSRRAGAAPARFREKDPA